MFKNMIECLLGGTDNLEEAGHRGEALGIVIGGSIGALVGGLIMGPLGIIVGFLMGVIAGEFLGFIFLGGLVDHYRIRAGSKTENVHVSFPNEGSNVAGFLPSNKNTRKPELKPESFFENIVRSSKSLFGCINPSLSSDEEIEMEDLSPK